MKHLFKSAWPAALLMTAGSIALTACGGGSTLSEPKPLVELNAPAYRMQVVWHRNTGDGGGEFESGFVPATANGLVYTANRDGEVAAFRLENGKRVWHENTDHQLVAGPGIVGDTLLMGTRNGDVVAVSAANGKPRWHTNLASEVLAAPAGEGSIAVARTVDGRVAALDLESGRRLWTIESSVPNLTMRGTASPIIRGNTVYVGTDSGKVLALDLATGEQRWEQTVALPSGRSELERIVDVDGNPLISGNDMYAASAGGAVVAMQPDTGQIRWKEDIASEGNLAVDPQHVYATDLNGGVWSLLRDSGDTEWTTDQLGYRSVSAPAVMDGNVVVGDYEGYVHWLSADNGDEIARGHPIGEAINAQPVVLDDSRALVLGAEGELAMVRFVANQ